MCAGIEPLEDRVVAVTMLLLLLPTAHRETLRALLDLCARVIEHEDVNKMSLFNVATIMAPNLFPPKASSKGKLKNEDKDQMVRNCFVNPVLFVVRKFFFMPIF